MRNQQNVKVRVNSNFETICPFPVGYVYMSSNSTSPGSIYGGTWASISGGRYMRAAAAWGNGGSNTITTANMPSHRHVLGGGRAHGFYWGDSDLNVSTDATASAGKPSGNKLGTKQQTWAATDYTGGGQHSTPLIKTFGRGTELPKEGDTSCVTFNKFKSVLQTASRKFVHFPLVIFICQPMAQAQQALTGVHGHLLQIINSCGQAVHGILQVEQVQTRITTGCRSAKKMAFRGYRLLGLTAGQMEQSILCVQHRLLTVFLRKMLILVQVQVTETQQKQLLITKLSQRFRLTAPVIAGIAQPSLAVM